MNIACGDIANYSNETKRRRKICTQCLQMTDIFKENYSSVYT